MQNVKDFIAANQTMPVAGAEVKKPTRMSYTARSELTDNACAKQLFKLMETKKTTRICALITSLDQVLALALGLGGVKQPENTGLRDISWIE